MFSTLNPNDSKIQKKLTLNLDLCSAPPKDNLLSKVVEVDEKVSF